MERKTPVAVETDGCSHSAAPTAQPPAPVMRSEVLLGNGRELRIDHQGRHYRLRVTRLGKLILTR